MEYNISTVISVLIGSIGILLAIVFYLRGRRFKKLSWAIRSNNIFTDVPTLSDKLKVIYSEKEIKTITISKLAFWNNGTEHINDTDIAPADPIKIATNEGVQLLDWTILQRTNESNRITVTQPTPNGNHLFINFDFLDKNDGFLIQITHTGNSSRDILLSGTVKGAGNPQPIIRQTYSRPYLYTMGILSESYFTPASPASLRFPVFLLRLFNRRFSAFIFTFITAVIGVILILTNVQIDHSDLSTNYACT